MAECSQKFKDMLSDYGGDCRSYGYNDGCRPEPSEDSILEYVAYLERGRDELRARMAEIERQEPVAHYRKSDTPWLQSGKCTTVYQHPAEDWTEPLYARPVPAIPEQVEGLVSIFSYDEVLTLTFADEAEADRFAARFEPSVDTAAAPEAAR
jgi:hypothetical protein